MNNWYNEIKSMYIIFVNMIIYLLFSFLQCFFFKKIPSTYVLIANIVQVFLIFYLSRTKFQNIKEKKRVFILLIVDTIILSPIMYYIYTLGFGGVIYNFICIFTALLSIDAFNNHMFCYEEYKSNIKISIILIICVGIIANIFFEETMKQIYSVYIIIMTLAILILRESRSYTYKIRNKASKKTNISIIICSLIIMIEPINKVIYGGVLIIKDFLFNSIEKITYYPLLFIGNIIGNIIEKTDIKTDIIKKEGIKKILLDNTKVGLNEMSPLSQLLLQILRYTIITFFILLIVLIILYLGLKIYKLIRSDYKDTSKQSKLMMEYDEIQAIERKKKKKKIDLLMFSSESKNIISIRKTYRKFLKQCTDMKVFKKYMSSTALNNVLKIKMKKGEDSIDEISKIYNEAKFSNHIISEEMVDGINKKYKNIKDTINRINN